MHELLVRPRSVSDLPACVAALAEVHDNDDYPSVWPADPVGWLSPGRLDVAWVAVDGFGVAGHLVLVGVDRADVFTGVFTGAMADAVSDGPIPGLLSVSRLFVTPRARGRGVARALLGRADEHAGEVGADLVLDVVDTAAAPIALYESLGWQLVERRTAVWSFQDGRHPVLRVYLKGLSTGGRCAEKPCG